MKTRSFSRSIKRWMGNNWREKLLEGAKSKDRRKQKPLRPAVELLEDRTLPSVLPLPLVTGQTDLITQINDSAFLGTHNTPSVSVDPTNSQRLVAVFTTNMTSVGAANPLWHFPFDDLTVAVEGAFSSNGGQTWHGFVPNDPRSPTSTQAFVLPDPTEKPSPTDPDFVFEQQTDASVAFDRNGNFYVVWSEHKPDNTAGAIRFAKFSFTGGSPVESSIGGDLYDWAGPSGQDADAALKPTIVVDTSLPAVVPDPNNPGQFVSFVDPIPNANGTFNTQTDPFSGNIYVAWETNNAHPFGPPPVQTNFNPNTIKVVMSSDGGLNFSTQRFANNSGLGPPPSFFPAEPNFNENLPFNFQERDENPGLAVSQGTISNRPIGTLFNGQAVAQVAGGELSIVWNDFGRGRNQIRYNRIADGGSAFTFSTGDIFKRITDAATPPPNSGSADITIPTLSTINVNIPTNDPRFTTASDVNVKLNIVGADMSEVEIRLLPTGKLNQPYGIAISPPTGPNPGNVFVTSFLTNSFAEYDATSPTGTGGPPGTGQLVANFVPSGNAALNHPTGLAFDPITGNLFVLSSGDNQILEYSIGSAPNPTITFLGQFAGPSTGLMDPEDLIFDSNENLYVTSHNNNEVIKFDTLGNPSIFVTPGSGGLSGPEGLVFGPDGNLYVASKLNSSVLEYQGPTGPSPGAFIKAYVPSGFFGLSSPEGLTFGADGMLYVTSDSNNMVLRFEGPNIPFTIPGAPIERYVPQVPGGTGLGGLDSPQGITWGPGPVGGDLNLYVVSKNTNSVMRYAPVPGTPQPTAGQPTTSAQYVTSGTQGLSNPGALLLRRGANGFTDFLVTSYNNSSIYSFDDSTGAFNSIFVGQGSGGLAGPTGMAQNTSNLSLYVTSQLTNSVKRYDGPTGAFIQDFVGGGQGGLSSPSDIVIDSGNSNLFVASQGNNVIMRYKVSDGTNNPGTNQTGAVFVPTTDGTNYTLHQVNTLAIFNGSPTALYVSDFDPNTGISRIYRFDPGSGVFQNVFASSLTSPLAQVQRMFVDVANNRLYVTTVNNKVLRYNLTTGLYYETVVPLAGVTANNGGLTGAAGVAYNGVDGRILVVSSGNDSVMRYTAPPAQSMPTPANANSGAYFTNPGGGAQAITLVAAHTDNSGVSVMGRGVSGGANMGVSTQNGTAIGTVFDQSAARVITDPKSVAPWENHYQPEDPAGFSVVIGLTAAQLNGTWTLEVIDQRNNGNPPPPQWIQNWSVTFTSGMHAGTDVALAGPSPLPQPPPLAGRPDSAGSTITSVNFTDVGNFPDVGSTAVSPDRGIGPLPVIASDNTLGAFSPYQGRLYVAYVAQGPNGADNTDVYMTFSDDGGRSWSKAPIRLNDDSITDGFSEGNRPQFMPNLAVDQTTGTLVATFYDVRNDPAHARVATYVATSIDGGQTFAPQTFLNPAKTVVDAITGEVVRTEPVPDNQGAGNPGRDTAFGFGNHQAVAIADGHLYAFWAGNQNGNGLDIWASNANIADGPRIVSGGEGPVDGQLTQRTALAGTLTTVVGSSPLPTVNGAYVGMQLQFTTGANAGQARQITGYTAATQTFSLASPLPNPVTPGDQFAIIFSSFAADGTRIPLGFEVTFDRPVDPSTFSGNQVQVMFRNTTTAAANPPILLNDATHPASVFAENDSLNISATVTSTTPPTLQSFSGPASLSGVDEFYDGDTILFTTGVNAGLARQIFSYTGLTSKFTFISPWPKAPAPGDQFIIETGTGPALAHGATTFLVRFDPTNALTQGGTYTGTYSYQVGPNISDRVRSFKLVLGPGSSIGTLTSTPNKVVPPQDTGGDGGGALFDPRDTTSDSIFVPTQPAGQLITKVIVSVNISHSSDSDLVIFLQSPDGTLVELTNRNPKPDNSGFDIGYINTVFDDSATTSIDNGTDPFTGTFRPDQPLATFIGKPPTESSNNAWTLFVDDLAIGDTGVLNSWSLNIFTAPGSFQQTSGNAMDQNANSIDGEPPPTLTNPYRPPHPVGGDTFIIPTPLTGVPFQLPYEQNTLPVIVPGPHIVSSFVPGEPATVDRNGSPFPNLENLVLNGTASSIDIVFDRDMDPTTVTPSMILRMMGLSGQITGPFTVTPDPTPPNARIINGNLTTAADPDSAHPRTYRIAFPTQKLSGTYTITMAPQPKSTKGELLDTNENAGLDVLRGTSPSVVPDSVQANPAPTAVSFAGSSSLNPTPNIYNGLTLTFTSGVLKGLSRTIASYSGPTHVFTFTSNWPAAPQVGDTFQIFNSLPVSHSYSGPAVTLTPGKTTAIPFTFGPENFTIQGVQVKLNITYPFDPDLEGSLVAPDGTTVTLFTRVGSAGTTHANFTNTIFDDNGTTPIQNGIPPFNSGLSGSFTPQTPLSVLKGKGSIGTWTLLIKNDNTGTVTGTHTLNNWSLTLDEAIPGTGLGEQVADQATVHFRIFTEDPQNVLSHTNWTAVGPSAVAGNLGPVPSGAVAVLPNGSLPALPNLELHSNSGLVSSVAVDPSDPSGNTVYVGGASGGIWKTTNFLTTDPNGPTWIPLTDFGPTFSINIGSIAVFGRNNDPKQSIIIAGTGYGPSVSRGLDYFSQGIGFLRSMDGGATWTLLDSTNNVDASNNVLPFNSPSRDHIFSMGTGVQTFKVVVDPVHAPSGPNDVIIYAAMGPSPGNANLGLAANPNGGLWFSQDSGNHWKLLSNPSVETNQATDLLLAPNSASVSSGNLQRLYVAFAGGTGAGVYMSQAQGQNLTLMTGGIGNSLIRDGDNSPATSIPVANPGVNPNGANGGITLAIPALTHNPVEDLLYEGWLYAAVSNADGSLRGVYVTKDAGANWTLIQLPIYVPRPNTAFPSNDETRANANPFGDQGFYDSSIALDPNNPEIVYLGGQLPTLEPGSPANPSVGGMIRVDITGIEDPHALYKWDNSNKDTGLLQAATLGSVTLKPPPAPPLGVYDQIPDGMGGFIKVLVPSQWINLISDPFNPFLTNSTVLVSDTAAFNNTGQDLKKYGPFDGDGGGDFTGDWHQIVSIKDPLTGHARLLFGTDHGVFSTVDQGDGNLFQSIGGVSDLSTPGGTTPVITGSRNGNLQITQFYAGAAQPSVQAAEIAAQIQGSGGLFYGNADDNGFPVSDPHTLTNGNLTWQGPSPSAGVTHGSLGDGTGIATDQTGSGTAYSFQWPSTGLFSFLSFTNFFVVNPSGTGYIARTGTGGTSLVQANNPGPVPDPQWPAIAAQALHGTVDVVQSALAANPIRNDQIVIGSAAGRVFRTRDQGKTWGPIADPTVLDGTIVTSLTYGAPDPANPSQNLDDFIYAGTAGGKLFVTLDGGGVNGKDWVEIDDGKLDGNPIMSISANPVRGMHEAYIVTLKNVYHVTFSVSYPTSLPPNVGARTWTLLTGNLFSTSLANGLFVSYSNPNNTLAFNLTDTGGTRLASELRLQYLTSLAVDWRFQVPSSGTGGTVHPLLYVGGEGGVFRSTNSDIAKSTSWTVFPNVANDGAIVDGGYLPSTHVTSLTLSVGNINSTTGQPDQATGPNLLIASTFGRGTFAIRLPINSPFNPVSGPIVQSVTPNVSGGSMSSLNVTFAGTVDPATFVHQPSKITSFVGPNGPITVTDVQDVTPPPPPGLPNPHNVYQVFFSPAQTSTGPYTIVIGPNIADYAGNLMDQDRDGPPNGQADDAFTGRFFINTSTGTTTPVPGILGHDPSSGQLLVSIPSGNAFSHSVFGTLATGATWVDVVTGDFNGDGKTDIAARWLQAGQWWVGINTGNSFAFSLWTTWSTAATWVDVKVGDFTGDGKDDIVGRWLQGGQWWVATSLGNSFSNTLWASWSPAVTWVDTQVGDFDGDGRADITSRWLQGGSWWTGLSTGTSFNTSQWAQWSAAVTWVDVRVGDFNGAVNPSTGDRIMDITARWKEGGQWWTGISTGSSFNTSLWASWSPSVTWVDIRVGDFNGDGIDDITGRWLEGGQWWTGISTGTSFNTSLWASWSPAVSWVNVVVGDFNGDGKADIAGMQSTNWWTGVSTGAGFNTTLWDTWPAANWTDVQVMKST